MVEYWSSFLLSIICLNNVELSISMLYYLRHSKISVFTPYSKIQTIMFVLLILFEGVSTPHFFFYSLIMNEIY